MVQGWFIPEGSSERNYRRSSPGPGNYEQVDLNFVREQAPIWSIKGKYPK